MTQTTSKTDSELAHAVDVELHWIPSVDNSRIAVTVTNGTVELSGEVGTYPEKLLAETAALRVPGVVAIVPDLTVRQLDSIDDTALTRGALEALHRAVDVPDSVQVAVHDGIVSLTGAVTWQFERAAAAASVQYLRGVTGVHNTVTIRPGAMAGHLPRERVSVR